LNTGTRPRVFRETTGTRSRVLSRIAAALILLGPPILSMGCVGTVESFSLSLPGNRTAVIRERPNRSPSEEGVLVPARGGSYESSLYLTQKALALGDGEFFFVTYLSPGPLTLIVEYERGESSVHTLPAALPLPRKQYVVPERKRRIEGFRFESTVDGARILGAGTSADPSGFAFDGRSETLGVSVEIGEGSLGGRRSRVFRFVPDPDRQGGWATGELLLSVSYRFSAAESAPRAGEGEGIPELPVVVRGQGSEQTFLFRPDRENGSFLVYPDSIGFFPLEIEIPTDALGFQVTDVTWRPFSINETQPMQPIPADLSSVLDFPMARWRRTRVELFSWLYVPKILIIDFRDYGSQSDFFRRLSFFVEKKGWAGSIPVNGELDGLHDWNAHDYRAEDLARFFRKAEEESIPLTTGEAILRGILVENGVLVEVPNGISAGEGAILSICRETSARLRRVFLEHEIFHGIFFTDPDFADEVALIWDGRSEAERWFWRVFLDSKEYNVNDPYLVVNEYQAYLLQQPADEADAYFTGYIIPRLLSQNPVLRPEMERFLRECPSPFSGPAAMLETALRDSTGFINPRLISRTGFSEQSAVAGSSR
jgi:hypothetical protein